MTKLVLYGTILREATLTHTNTGFLISQIKRVQDRVFQRLLMKSGVDAFNSPQGSILYVLWEQDQVPIRVIAQKTGLAKNTLTSMLARMEEAGLVHRQASREDQRQVLVGLTPRARELQVQFAAVSEEMNRLFYRGLSQKDADLLDGLLGDILRNLEETERALRQEASENQRGAAPERNKDGKGTE